MNNEYPLSASTGQHFLSDASEIVVSTALGKHSRSVIGRKDDAGSCRNGID
jgi:hypothetical protein